MVKQTLQMTTKKGSSVTILLDFEGVGPITDTTVVDATTGKTFKIKAIRESEINGERCLAGLLGDTYDFWYLLVKESDVDAFRRAFDEVHKQGWIEKRAALEKTDPEYRAQREWERSFVVARVIFQQKAKGGEDGQNGFFTAVYREVATGEEVTFETRDIFDFGCFHFSTRDGAHGADGKLFDANNNGKFDDSRYTDVEKRCHRWLKAFRHKTTRM